MRPTLNDALERGYEISHQPVYDDDQGMVVMSWALTCHDELVFISSDLSRCVEHLHQILLEESHGRRGKTDTT